MFVMHEGYNCFNLMFKYLVSSDDISITIIKSQKKRTRRFMSLRPIYTENVHVDQIGKNFSPRERREHMHVDSFCLSDLTLNTHRLFAPPCHKG